jgi:hypothetical protein
MNRMTRPLRTRPVQSAGFETGVVSAIVDMACSRGEWMHALKTNEADAIRQRA